MCAEETSLDPAITAFAEIARRFCAWAEKPGLEQRADMHSARRLLAELHAALLQLPEAGPGQKVRGPKPPAGLEQVVFARLQKLPADVYHDIFNPLDAEDRQLVSHSLANDLMEIWAGLRRGLSLVEEGQPAEAVREWRFSFDSRWGSHLVRAQRVLHSYFA
jgi:hypothetical protein